MSAQSFGKYQLLKKLATGGMAEVYLARQTGIEGFNRLVVLKRILPHLAEDQEFVQMFLNEARIAAKFNHPNIAQIYELMEESGSYGIAMEYIHGEDLGRVMRKAWSTGQWIAQPLAIRIIASCCEGLGYAHNKADEGGRPLRVVHRDISPQNILISFDGTVKLVDFGIAKAADLPSLTKSGAIKGKFAYMAPEQAAGKPLDHRSDIFAIGLVLYELLTGVRPLKRDNEIATLQAALECAIEPPSAVAEVTPDLDGVVMKALAKPADDRWRDARQFQMALEEYLVSQRMVASSVQISELMNTLFADRLAEEAKTGMPEPPAEDSKRRESSHLSKGSSDAAADMKWDAPPATGTSDRPRTQGRGMAKGSYKSSPSEPSPEPAAPPADAESWEAPPATEAPRRSRTGMQEISRKSLTQDTALARTPSRSEVPRTRSGVMHTRVAPPDPEEEGDAIEEVPLGAQEAPRRSGSSTSVPRSGTRDAMRRMSAAAMPAVAPKPEEELRDQTAEAPAPKPRAKTRDKLAVVQEKPEKPRRRISKEVARPQLSPEAEQEIAEYVDVEQIKERSGRTLKKVLVLSVAISIAALVIIFKDAIWATLNHVPATGQEVFVTVESSLPVQVSVKHHPDEHPSRAVEPLTPGEVTRVVRLTGAHLRDTVILENAMQGARFEHEIKYGQPHDNIEIRKEFRTGNVLFQLEPKLRDAQAFLNGQPKGNANIKVGAVEGTQDFEIRSESLKKPVKVEVNIVAGDTITKVVKLPISDPEAQ